MGASRALALEQLLAGQGFVRKPGGLLSGAGARLARACELPARRSSRGSDSLIDLLTRSPGEGGGLVELAARRSSGRFAIALAALAAATSAGEAAALVDLGDHLDPQGAEEAGVDLARLLWVRPRRAKEAVAAAEMLLCAGFPLVVADFGLSPRGARYLPDAAWVRLARAAEARGSALLLATPWRLAGVAAQSAVSASSSRPRWQGSGRAPLLLAGLSARLTLERDARARSGLAEPLTLRAPEALVPLSPLPLCDPRDPRKAVETRVKAHDPGDTLALHHGQVQRVPGGQARVAEHDALGALDVGELHSEDLVDDSQERVEGGLDSVPPVDGDVAVEDLLEHLDVRDEALCVREELLQRQQCVPFMGVLRPHQIHRDIRVQEDHRDGASR
jgi:hypothetical protein